MNTYHIITYATHSEGNYNYLINNRYGVNIITLGWNTKWEGYNYKFKLLYNYIKNLPDDDIIISLDGFDVWINGDADEAVSIFKKMHVKTLFSLDIYQEVHNNNNNNTNIITNTFFNSFIIKKMYGKCIDNLSLNTGLYMGYVKYIKILLKDALLKPCKDDQRIFNSLCKKYDFITIDYNNQIFENVNNIKKIKNSSAYFVQCPGNLSLPQMFKRFIKVQAQFWLKDFIIILAILLSIFIYLEKYITMNIIIILFIILVLYTDISCI